MRKSVVPIAGTPVKSIVLISFSFCGQHLPDFWGSAVDSSVVRNSVCSIHFKHVKCISRGGKMITFFRDAFRKKTLSK